MNTAVQRKYINNRVYPIVAIDGTGGRRQIMPGEVVGEEYQKHVDMKKGLIPYNGPRNIGEIERLTLPAQGGRPPARGETQIPGIQTPRIEGAQPTDSISMQAVQSGFHGKNVSEWAKESAEKGLVEYSRGTLLGLAQFLGIQLNEMASKKDVITVIASNLQAVRTAEEVNTRAMQQAKSPEPDESDEPGEETKKTSGKKGNAKKS